MKRFFLMSSLIVSSLFVSSKASAYIYYGGPAHVTDNGDGTVNVGCPGVIVMQCADWQSNADIWINLGGSWAHAHGKVSDPMPGHDGNGVPTSDFDVTIDYTVTGTEHP